MEQENRAEIIDILATGDEPTMLWYPAVGHETLGLLEEFKVPESSRESIKNEAVEILGKCVPYDEIPVRRTGLVVGYIQSGKTMSFTTVAALARDNRYQLIIVITGISTILFEQSTRRLQRDLRLNTRPDRKWQLYTNPTVDDASNIENTLRDWHDTSVSEDQKQTILITVMKNHQHLANLTLLLERLDLAHAPTLVIDDEADQAGLNTLVNQGEESTTYRRLGRLRRALPHHTYLQYTATPQAPLLINIIDILSPDFAEVLTPGSAYVGGLDFFGTSNNYVRTVSLYELRRAHSRDEPPQSLLEALRLFFLGVAAGFIQDMGQGNRSMLIHPSQRQREHRRYFNWVNRVKDHWLSVLELPDSDLDRLELIRMFQAAFEDLKKTVPDLPSFNELCVHLPRAIRRSRVEEVNASSGSTPVVDWNNNYAYILVGGQAMDRGYTVEGLTVTYMPRTLGVGNMDTIQQRARFFGYKRSYLGFCRVYLTNEAREAYRKYVDHEENVRSQLTAWEKTGRPLSEWKRAFLMPSRLRPTRPNVLELPYDQGWFSSDWWVHRAPHDSEDAVEENWEVVRKFISNLELEFSTLYSGTTPATHHLISEDVSLRFVHEELLTQLRVTRPSDSRQLTGLLLQIRTVLENNPNEQCSVLQMAVSDGEWIMRERALTANDEIENLFQGASPPIGPRRGADYAGDRNIGDHDRIIIQLHRNRLTRVGQTVAEDVPTIAMWFPERYSSLGWLVQDQPAQG